jgi:hypothetical protein
MSPRNRKAGDRRLVQMSELVADQPWYPELPPVDPYSESYLINETTKIIQKLGHDERERLAEWAVIQQKLCNGEWKTVAVYDNCHFKGVHRHLYNRDGARFDEKPIARVTSYNDVALGLDSVLDWLGKNWLENERRWARGN